MVARRTITTLCSKCRAYVCDDTRVGAGGLRCANRGQESDRERMMAGKPAHKIIQGKVSTKGMRRK